MKKILLVFISLLAVLLVACDNTEKEKLEVSETNVSIKVGDTHTFNISQKVSYMTNDKDVIELNKETGTIKGLKAGSAIVTIYLIDDTSEKVDVNITVTEDETKSYKVTYDLDGGTCENLVNEFKEGSAPTLPTPSKEGFEFKGWFEGETEVKALDNKDYNLKAKWEGKSFTIKYDLDDESCEPLVETFVAGESVSLPTPTKEGYKFLGWYEEETKVEKLEYRNYNLKAKWEAVPEIVLSMNTEAEIYYTDINNILQYKVLPESSSQEVIFKALTPSKASIDEEGWITIKSTGVATFKVISAENEKLSATISINVVNHRDPYKWLDSIQIANPVAKKVRAYDSNEGYETYVLGSIIYLYFDEIEVTQNIIPEGRSNRPGTTKNGITFYPRYVTIHDVGAGGNAASNSSYCVASGTTVSWHYTVGNDGIYQQLPLNEIGYHAGDGTSDELEFYDSGVKAPKGDKTPATITINQTTGYYMVNGQESLVKAPTKPDGSIAPDSCLPDNTGINNYVDEETGNYMISKTWWNTDFGGKIGNRGGNLNSIGIESAVNKGSSLWLTWAKMAKLVSTVILPQTGLTPYDVKQHNTFAGKNCPNTMRTAKLWPNFMEYVNAEYMLVSELSNFKVELICDSEYVNANGLLNYDKLPEEDTEISYQVRLISKVENIDITVDYKTTIPAKSKVTY